MRVGFLVGGRLRQRARRLAIVIIGSAVTAAGATSIASADPPGNNGDVKIEITGFVDGNANHPHPGCSFSVQGFGFDAFQSMSFTVDGQGGANVRGEDSLGPVDVQADADGNFGPVGGFVLSAGMYKLDLSTNEPGGHKFKVFRVECEAPPITPLTPASVTPSGVSPAAATVGQPSAASAAPTEVVQGQPHLAG
jgi:hypothetical protein